MQNLLEKKFNFDQDFYIYRIKRRIEEKSLEDNTNLSFKFQCNLLINKISFYYSFILLGFIIK